MANADLLAPGRARALGLRPGEVLHKSRSAYLQERGEYWVDRMKREYGLIVPGTKPYRFTAVYRVLGGEVYGVTYVGARRITLEARLWDVGLHHVDEVLVHELVHATKPKGPAHGPEFKKRYGSVYPWSKPGPVTEHDPGTPRRKLWRELTTQLPGNVLPYLPPNVEGAVLGACAGKTKRGARK